MIILCLAFLLPKAALCVLNAAVCQQLIAFHSKGLLELMGGCVLFLKKKQNKTLFMWVCAYLVFVFVYFEGKNRKSQKDQDQY